MSTGGARRFLSGKIETKDGKDTYGTLGSAVIAVTDEHHGCLLTAKHMVSDPRKNWEPTEIRMRLARNASSDDPDFGVKVILVLNGEKIWKSLPDGSDLAVIPFGAISRDEQSKLSDLTVANGVKLGRKLKVTHHQQLPAEAVRWHGQIGQKSFKLYMWVTQNLISLALCLKN